MAHIDKKARSESLGQTPCIVWLTGVPAAGKSTIANALERRLFESGRLTYILDGDVTRQGLCRDLGFTEADRVENVRRVGEVARIMMDAGLIVIVALISPYRRERRDVRARVKAGEFIEVFVDTPVQVAEARDPKGLYKKARRGELKNFTGVDAPYEAPEHPEIRIETVAVQPEAAVDRIVAYLVENKIIRT